MKTSLLRYTIPILSFCVGCRYILFITNQKTEDLVVGLIELFFVILALCVSRTKPL